MSTHLENPSQAPGSAFRAVEVVCCEPDPRYASHARDWWRKAGVERKMEMHEVPAEALLQRLLDEGRAGTFDMVFVDVGERDRYSPLALTALGMRRPPC